MGRSKRQKPPPGHPTEDLASDLPCEIIHHILLRLPAKSLLQFKCVCKSWNALISDSKFILSHHKQSQASTNRAQVVYRHGCDRRFWTLSFEGDVDEPYIQNLHFPANRNLNILCWCEGLVMMKEFKSNFVDHDLFLWNPSIRKYTKFPYPSHEETFKKRNIGYGLFYDSSSHDYKVILIHETHYCIYSVGEDSFGETKAFPYSIWNLSFGVFVNGALYWVAEVPGYDSDEYECRTGDIVCFDTKEENFRILSRPSELVGKSGIFNLTVLGGFLAFYYTSFETWNMTIWLRTGHDYDDQSCWGKSIVVTDKPALNGAQYRVWPFFYAQESKILLDSNRGRLVLYDVEEGKCLEVKGAPSRSFYYRGIAAYLDSLFLPGAGDNARRKWLTTEKRKRVSTGQVDKLEKGAGSC